MRTGGPIVPRKPIAQPANQDIRHIALTRGKVAVVDAGDYDWLTRWRWHAVFFKAARKWYAARTVNKGKGRFICILMHRLIADAPSGIDVDHFDQDGLNNTRLNLREATRTQNNCNRGAQKNNTSGYKGVFWVKRDRTWIAKIQVNRKKKYLGRFSTPISGARAYDEAARKYHGEFAFLNFPASGVVCAR